MTTFTALELRGMCEAAVAVVISAVVAAPATAAHQPPPRYAIHAALNARATTTANGAFDLRAALRAQPPTAVSSGGGFAMDARLNDSPLGCVIDFIFYDGFERLPK